MLLDSNILIYLSEGAFRSLEELLERPDLAIASVTRIETLGYHRLLPEHKRWLESIMESLREFPLDDFICQEAISLRQERKMGLADAIIAATALVHGLPLVTRNVDDFKHIDGLEIINPFLEDPEKPD